MAPNSRQERTKKRPKISTNAWKTERGSRKNGRESCLAPPGAQRGEAPASDEDKTQGTPGLHTAAVGPGSGQRHNSWKVLS